MFCTSCGHKLEAKSKFCVSCGQATAKVEAREPVQPEPGLVESQTKVKSTGFASSLISAVTFIVAIVMSRALGIWSFVFIIPPWAGYYLANWYLKRPSGDRIAQITAWSNVISWFLPPIGLYTATATLLAASQYRAAGKDSTRLYVLGTIGLVLTIVNAGLGALKGIGLIKF
jgi:hypothetical protein